MPSSPAELHLPLLATLKQLARRFLAPGQRLMARLNFASRMALTGLVFAIPIGLLMATSHGASQDMVRITVQERSGVTDVLASYSRYAAQGRMSAADVEQIAMLADSSSLTLDTDLDSYYLMHALTVLTPSLLRSMTDLTDIERDAARSVQARQSAQLVSDRALMLRQALDKAGYANGAVKAAMAPLARLLEPYGNAAFARSPLPPEEIERDMGRLFAMVPSLGRQLDQLLAQRIDRIERHIWQERLVVIAALALVAYLAAAAWCSVMDSVARIVDGAQRIANGNFDRRIEVHTSDEIGLLADSLNDLRSQLQERLLHEQAKLEAQRRLIADIAHELGTPLGNIHVTAGSLTLAANDAGQRLRDNQLTRSGLQRVIDDFSGAADMVERSANKAATLLGALKHIGVDLGVLEKERLPLADVARRTFEDLQRHVPGMMVRIDVPESLSLNSYRRPLEEVFFHMFQNAYQHAGGSSEITLSAHRAERHVVVRFADNGPGVAQEAARRVFSPFYTTRQEHGQLGMGLYIVSNLVTHILSGRIFVVHSEEGFVLQLELPA